MALVSCGSRRSWLRTAACSSSRDASLAKRFDVGEANRRQHRQDQAALVGEAGALLRLRQAGEVLRDAGELIGEAARVGFVEQQQVEHQGQHGIEPVARAVGNEAVGDLEQEEQASCLLLALQRMAEQPQDGFAHVAGALDAATHVEERPAFVAGHVLVHQAVEGGQPSEPVLEEVEQRFRRRGEQLAAPVGTGAEMAEHAPGFERETVARQVGDAVELVERAVEGAATVLGGDEEVHHALDGGSIVAVAGRHDLRLVAHRQGFEAGARGTLHVRGRVVAAQRLQRAAQHAHDPVGALGVAAEPEQVVGDAALDDALRALHAGGLDGRLPQAAVRRHLAVGDDPDIARARFRRAEGDGKVGHDGHGEAAGHDREAVGGGGDEQANGEGLRHEALRR